MTTTDIKAAVAEVREKRQGGRPRVESDDPAVRARRAKDRERKAARAKEQTADTPREPYVPDEGSIQLCGMLATQLWDLSRLWSKRRALQPEEARKLGETLDPLFHKYLPVLGDWAEEVAFVLAVASVWQTTAPPPAPPEEAEASVTAGVPGLVRFDERDAPN